MTAEQILKIISNNYLYFQHKKMKATTEEEYNQYNCALQGVYCIMLDIQKEENFDGKEILGLQKTE